MATPAAGCQSVDHFRDHVETDSGKLAAFLAFISAINQCRTGNAFAQRAPDIGNWPHRLRADGLRGFYFDHAYVL